jgi:hypothetical protein
VVDVDEHLGRLSSLLRPSRAGVSLTERDPYPAPETVGALAGVGFETPDAEVVASVYVFDGQETLDAAARTLQEQAQVGSSRIAQNGPLLFYGVARAEGAACESAGLQLRKLASAFAGEE